MALFEAANAQQAAHANPDYCTGPFLASRPKRGVVQMRPSGHPFISVSCRGSGRGCSASCACCCGGAGRAVALQACACMPSSGWPAWLGCWGQSCARCHCCRRTCAGHGNRVSGWWSQARMRGCPLAKVHAGPREFKGYNCALLSVQVGVVLAQQTAPSGLWLVDGDVAVLAGVLSLPVSLISLPLGTCAAAPYCLPGLGSLRPFVIAVIGDEHTLQGAHRLCSEKPDADKPGIWQLSI